MWATIDRNGSDIAMIQHDFGIAVPTTVKGIDISQTGSVKITIKKEKYGEALIEKDYDSITDNTIYFELTRDESERLEPGNYFYLLDWYEGDTFMCNIINGAHFKVVKKA